MENFSLEKIKTLSQIEAKAYLIKYFVPLSNGNHAMLINGKYEVKEDNEVKKTYFNRISKELYNYYFKEYTQIKTITYKLNQPIFFDDKINLCPKMKHSYKPFKEFSKDIQDKVQIVLDFIHEIWCPNKKESYNFCIKWLANMIQGNKNNSVLYLKSVQGTGKSTITTFLKEHVLGNELSLESGSEPLKSKFNSILGGKVLVIFEELENFSTAEWQTVDSVLKRNTTSKYITLQSKGVDSYETENLNNYILNSNNEAIKDEAGRRIFPLEINTKHIGNKEFFNNIYRNCFNDEVGHAFFCYLMEISTKDFNPQDFPENQNKSDAIVKRLDSTYQFLKDMFIFKENIN